MREEEADTRRRREGGKETRRGASRMIGRDLKDGGGKDENI